MNKNDLIRQTAKQLDLSIQSVHPIIDTFIANMCSSLAKQEKVVLTGFGSFRIHKLKVRPVRNPRNGDPYMLVPRNSIRFVISSNLSDLLNEEPNDES